MAVLEDLSGSLAQLSEPGKQEWRAGAACSGLDVRLFFPAGEDPVLLAQAKAVCNVCEVAHRCLEAGLREPEGIWGGLSPEERRKIVRRGRARAAATA